LSPTDVCEEITCTHANCTQQITIQFTSNVTGITEVGSASAVSHAHKWGPWWVLLQHSIMLQLLFIVACGIARFLCAMHVFEVRASSSCPRLPLCQISFLLQAPLLS